MVTEIDKIIAYEQGELEDREIVNLFSELIKNGNAWTLQGHYGRTAKGLIDSGLIDKNGVIDEDYLEEILNNDDY